jgi:outer membrane protein, heavy metal efflux system
MVEPKAPPSLTRLLPFIAGGLLAAGCYHAQPVSDQDLVSELRAPLPAPTKSGAEATPPAAAAPAPVTGPAAPGTGRTAPADRVAATPTTPAPARATPERAEDAPASGAGLTEDQAVAAALVRNPDLRAFRRKRQVAEGHVVMAGAIPNPSLKLEALHLQKWGDAGPGIGVGLQWTPPQPGERSARKGQAEARVQEIQQEILEREWQIAFQVRIAHTAVVELEEQQRLLEAAASRRQRIVELVTKRTQLGASTRLDLSLATLALAQLERDRDDIEAQRAIAADTLASLLGLAEVAVAPQRTPSDSGALPTPPDVRTLEDQALAARPALRAARARYHAREQAVRREYAQRWPWIQLTAAPRYRFNPSSNNYRNDLYLGIELTLPIFNWNTGGIQVAEAERAEEREKMVALLSNIRREIVSARARLEVHRAALRRFRERVLPALVEHERVLQQAIRGGQVDLVALTAAEDVVLRHQRAHAELRLRYRKAWLELERAVGAPVATAAR